MQILEFSIDGAMVVSANGFEAFLWDQAHGVRSLFDVLTTDYGLVSSLTGWRLTRATAISPDGQAIVGYDFNPKARWRPDWCDFSQCPCRRPGICSAPSSGEACRLCPTEPGLTHAKPLASTSLPEQDRRLYNAPLMTSRRASLHTLGCRLNLAESAVLGEGLRRKGFELVEFGRPTDLLVLNTCAVTEDAERTSRYLIRKTLKHSPHAFIAVTGCYAQIGLERLTREAGIDLVVGNQFKLDLPSYLPPADALEKRRSPEILHTKTLPRQDFDLPYFGEPDSTRAPLKIQDGCNAMCGFCIIPFSRGHERSRRLEDIMEEATALAARGYREIVLTGVNIGRYLHDGRDFCSLLRRLDQVDGIDRIRISSIEPTTVGDELLDLLAGSSKLCPSLHVPLQSGDDGVLNAMNRRHTVRAYADLIERAVAKIPQLGLGTDLMAGFPGETEAAFRNTVSVATDLPFSYLHVFPYSPRPGTAAARMKRAVSPSIIRKRVDVLRDIGRRKQLAFHHRQIGTTVPVLFETGVQDGLRHGTTPNFTKVAVAGTDDLHNQIKPVTITAATDRWVMGQVAVPQRPPNLVIQP